MTLIRFLPLLGLLALLGLPRAARAQSRPYIGFIYPAGGQTNTTFEVHVGGQRLDGVVGVQVTGKGVKARIIDYRRQLGAQQMRLLRDQINDLRKITRHPRRGKPNARGSKGPSEKEVKEAEKQLAKIQKRTAATVQRPACGSIANVAILEVTIDKRALPGERELRLSTLSGVSNPMVFYVGQVREVSRKPLGTCEIQVLGKEEAALRRRPPEESETKITLPATVNGQISPGEVDRYRFAARKGQKLVISTLARQLVPYIADAVPGWFQPVLTLMDSNGRELAYEDDFRFKPDPVIIYEVPADGEYLFTIRDGIYRGREDFVYRITAGELPYVTSVYPMGWKWGREVPLKATGVNLGAMKLAPPSRSLRSGIHMITKTLNGRTVNPIPFAVDMLPETHDREPNNELNTAQSVTLPVIVNGRVDQSGDWDVFQFSGKAGQTVVLDVMARRLESPLDSILRLTDAAGRMIASNDDHAEPGGGGLNTHHADSHISAILPANDTYFVFLGDTTQAGGDEHGYRLRIGGQQPDFELRVEPSSISVRNRSSAKFNVHAIRKDGFSNPITLSIPGLPRGLTAAPVVLVGTQKVAQLTVKANWKKVNAPFSVAPTVMGSAFVNGRTPTHERAIPTEDRMQAFLWRHLVPAADLKVHVYDPSYKPPVTRFPSVPPVEVAMMRAEAREKAKGKDTPTFSKNQVRGRLRDLKRLFDEGLLTGRFYVKKVIECEPIDD
jgi:hypothetical protein